MISAVVLSHNDALTIQKTLVSLSWCDEILVIDDESLDKTREIAKEHHAVVYERKLSGDFAAQRNFGLSKAKNEWVLFVDSDESLTKELTDEIQHKVLDSRLRGNDNIAGYFIKRIDTVFGHVLQHGETGNIRLLRLARKDIGLWVRPVHEIWDIQGTTALLTNPLLHFPHPNVTQFLSSVNLYSTLNATYLYRQGIREPLWKIPVYPFAKFFMNYVWHLGFLDGTAGIVVALMMSFHSFLTRAKLYMVWKNTKS